MTHFGASDYKSLIAAPHSLKSLAATSAHKVVARAWAMRSKQHKSATSALAGTHSTKDLTAAAAAAAPADIVNASVAQQAPAQASPAVTAAAAAAATPAPAVNSSNTTASSS